MTLITRRAALGGFAALPTLGVLNANAQANVPDENIGPDNYATEFTPEDRLRHHIQMAMDAMSEIVTEENSRWVLVAGGDANTGGRYFHLERLDTVPIYEPRMKTKVCHIENATSLIRWQA
jgi:hypothetical protein